MDATAHEVVSNFRDKAVQHYGSTPFKAIQARCEAVFLADRIAVMRSKPGRIATVIDVPFPRPREKSLFTEPAFHALNDAVARALHGA
jgi:NitT/TauT family transport system ATP-binding protein